jgi:hypothetical protein
LENVYVQLELQDEENNSLEENLDNWKIETIIPIKSLPTSKIDICYVLLKMPEDGRLTGQFGATLIFKVRDVDPTTGEPESEEFYDDVYAVYFLKLNLLDSNCKKYTLFLTPTPFFCAELTY